MRFLMIAVLALVPAGLPGATLAQESQPRSVGLDVSGGIGPASQGTALVAAVAVSTPHGEFVIRGAEAEEFKILTTPETSSWDLALLYGWKLRDNLTWLRVAAGPAIAHTTWRGDPIECFIFCRYEKVRSQAPGLAVQADGVWAFSRVLGLGIGAFADFNGDNSFGGVTLGLHVGWLR